LNESHKELRGAAFKLPTAPRPRPSRVRRNRRTARAVGWG